MSESTPFSRQRLPGAPTEPLADRVAAVLAECDAARVRERARRDRIAAIKAEHAGLEVKGAVMASDAFFPFRDGIDNSYRSFIISDDDRKWWSILWTGDRVQADNLLDVAIDVWQSRLRNVLDES